MNKQKPAVAVWWLRRDLRLHDNNALKAAMKSGFPTLPLFVFDTEILRLLPSKRDDRVCFILDALKNIQTKLNEGGSTLETFYGTPLEAFRFLSEKYELKSVFCGKDYEPYAQRRDAEVTDFLSGKGVPFLRVKDHVIFEEAEVVKDNGEPYTVFTPYSRRWKEYLKSAAIDVSESDISWAPFFRQEERKMPSLREIGFEPTGREFPSIRVSPELLRGYAQKRDFPGLSATSGLGVHLRFGTVSIRQIVAEAQAHSEAFLNELIWREFYQMIVRNFPHVGRGEAFRREYDRIEWRNNEDEFEKWCRGETGYPLVDAGMRELNATGLMHNRVRMVAASFLTKHLLIDWRWGESWFASRLLDFEYASNNGGWQWAAGCGCDAAPYFRIFNPALQLKKFDPELRYIRKWIPEIHSGEYPEPLIDHAFARERCLAVYRKAIRGN